MHLLKPKPHSNPCVGDDCTYDIGKPVDGGKDFSNNNLTYGNTGLSYHHRKYHHHHQPVSVEHNNTGIRRHRRHHCAQNEVKYMDVEEMPLNGTLDALEPELNNTVDYNNSDIDDPIDGFVDF